MFLFLSNISLTAYTNLYTLICPWRSSGLFQFLVLINRATVSIHTHIFVWIYFFHLSEVNTRELGCSTPPHKGLQRGTTFTFVNCGLRYLRENLWPPSYTWPLPPILDLFLVMTYLHLKFHWKESITYVNKWPQQISVVEKCE